MEIMQHAVPDCLALPVRTGAQTVRCMTLQSSAAVHCKQQCFSAYLQSADDLWGLVLRLLMVKDTDSRAKALAPACSLWHSTCLAASHMLHKAYASVLKTRGFPKSVQSLSCASPWKWPLW